MPALLTPAEADALIYERLTGLPIESLPLAQCVGAILRENVYAERDQPPFDRVTMDGIAIDSGACRDGRREFEVQGTQAAGRPQHTLTSSAHCLEVMTGAVLPQGCDCVIPVERLKVEDGRAVLADDVRVEPGLNIHRRGTDSQQGALLLETGTALRAPEIAIIASAGMSRARVSVQPSVMVISTGDELVNPGEPVLPHQIRRSNPYGVAAALRQRGFHRVGDPLLPDDPGAHLPDDPELMRDYLRRYLAAHDVLIMSGGVSMGRYDFVPKVLEELGVQQVFHKIAQRPGKPMWFGVNDSGKAVFALPGNPVSTLVCLVRYVLPALYRAMGREPPRAEKVALGEQMELQNPLALLLPVRVEYDDRARPWAVPRATRGSGDFTSLAGTDGFIELPPGPAVWPKGFVTSLYRW